MEHHRLNKHHNTFNWTDSTLMFLLQMSIQVILSSIQQSAFVTWKEAVVVVFSFVSIEIVLSSKTLLAYSTVKGIMEFIWHDVELFDSCCKYLYICLLQMHSCEYCQQTFAKKSQLMEHHRLNKHHKSVHFGVWEQNENVLRRVGFYKWRHVTKSRSMSHRSVVTFDTVCLILFVSCVCLFVYLSVCLTF
jgi:hypothetical protein